jgi:holo-[acyl-carrier protein] synthase
MIAGIGMDLVEIEKIALSISSEAYLRKVFTEAEIKECRSVSNAAERFAGKFAAKEAFMKAVGRGIRQGVWFTQIEVLNEASGAPYVRLYGEMESSMEEMGVKHFHISVTHTRDIAGAVVILEKQDAEL